MAIKIFTSDSCAFCSQLKRWLAAKNLSYEEVNISDHPEAQQEAFEVSGALTVPVTVIEGRGVVVGLNLSRLSSLLQ